jgi:hypothetical protein
MDYGVRTTGRPGFPSSGANNFEIVHIWRTTSVSEKNFEISQFDIDDYSRNSLAWILLEGNHEFELD